MLFIAFIMVIGTRYQLLTEKIFNVMIIIGQRIFAVSFHIITVVVIIVVIEILIENSHDLLVEKSKGMNSINSSVCSNSCY